MLVACKHYLQHWNSCSTKKTENVEANSGWCQIKGMLYETQTVMTIFPYMYAQTRNGKISKLTGLSSFHDTKFYALSGTEKTVWGASTSHSRLATPPSG